MIVGIGIDSVEIDRFKDWKNLPKDTLEKVLSKEEIAYCIQNNNAPERFAARFAAREAFFKALSQALPGNNTPFLTVCKHIKIEHEISGNPKLIANWEKLTEKHKTHITCCFTPFISLTHTKTVATAIIIIEKHN